MAPREKVPRCGLCKFPHQGGMLPDKALCGYCLPAGERQQLPEDFRRGIHTEGRRPDQWLRSGRMLKPSTKSVIARLRREGIM